jgi:stage III sporulation protein SpoIIIAA
VTLEDIDFVVARLGPFSGDNRAGIERTLHRISAMRNRQGRIVGLTLRVGRAVFGTIRIIQDLVEMDRSVLLLGRPGIGKTTMLREVARVLADDLKKRVVVVDTSNEIAGDGDIPHPAIGHARRMQVPSPALQHAVMIEAVENHMPEVIVIDEIGTELEAAAARTIAERGVQLVATAHGTTLGNLVMNPTLADLVGGVQPVTLGDEEARRRRTQKTVLERKAPPTFHIVVEIQERDRVAIHSPVGEVVDALLLGEPVTPEIRHLTTVGEVSRDRGGIRVHEEARLKKKPLKLYPYGVSRDSLEQAARELGAPVTVVDDMGDAELLVTTKAFYRRRVDKVRQGEARGLPIYVLRSNSPNQVRQFLSSVGVGETHPTPQEGEAQLRSLQQRISRFGFTSHRRRVKKL